MAGKRRSKTDRGHQAPRAEESPAAQRPAVLPLRNVTYVPDENVAFDEPLTVREREVLHWMADGKQNDEIATIIGGSKRTVEIHMGRLLRKLGAENRYAAIALYHHRIRLQQVAEIERLEAQVDALTRQLVALRRQLRREQ